MLNTDNLPVLEYYTEKPSRLIIIQSNELVKERKDDLLGAIEQSIDDIERDVSPWGDPTEDEDEREGICISLAHYLNLSWYDPNIGLLVRAYKEASEPRWGAGYFYNFSDDNMRKRIVILKQMQEDLQEI